MQQYTGQQRWEFVVTVWERRVRRILDSWEWGWWGEGEVEGGRVEERRLRRRVRGRLEPREERARREW